VKKIIELKKILKKFLYKYFRNIYYSLDYYLNLKKINKLKKYNFTIKDINFSMYSTENFINPSWQKKETDIIINLLKNNETFINLGANIGYYVCLASKFKVKIIAVEPDYFNLKVLYRNIELNNIDDCLVLPMASYSKNSVKPIFGRGVTASLFVNWDNTEKFDNKDFIQTFKLDELIKEKDLEKNTFILMDIENSEYETLIGAFKILKSKNRPSWIVEVHPTFYSQKKEPSIFFDQIFNLFWENEYLSFLITDNELIQIDKSNYKNDFKLNAKHNHNYLFIDKNKLENFKYLF
tara:strand:+ start:435 stop:1316 length:882 start_codon:yes stop_codon:yes gene_type:complete